MLLLAPTRSSDGSFVRVFSHFSFYSVALGRSRLRNSSPRLTPVLQYRCIDALQHRFQTYTKTIRIQARKSSIRNSLRTEIKPLEYEYNKCSGFNSKIYFRNLLDSLRLHPYRSTMLNFNKSVLATARLISYFFSLLLYLFYSFFVFPCNYIPQLRSRYSYSSPNHIWRHTSLKNIKSRYPYDN